MMWSNPKPRNFIVIVSKNEEYAFWPVEKPIPLGWQGAGKQGSKEECLDFIEEVWLDIRSVDIHRMWEEIENNQSA